MPKSTSQEDNFYSGTQFQLVYKDMDLYFDFWYFFSAGISSQYVPTVFRNVLKLYPIMCHWFENPSEHLGSISHTLNELFFARPWKRTSAAPGILFPWSSTFKKCHLYSTSGLFRNCYCLETQYVPGERPTVWSTSNACISGRWHHSGVQQKVHCKMRNISEIFVLNLLVILFIRSNRAVRG